MSKSWMKWMATGLLLVVGCADTGTTDSRGNGRNSGGGSSGNRDKNTLFARARPPIPDLPVPYGFDLNESRSRHWTVGQLRLVDHVYSGSADKFAVAEFYRTQMPINRWERVREHFAQGKIMLDFDKGDERCHVVIQEKGWGDGIEIQIMLSSSGKISTPAGSRRGT